VAAVPSLTLVAPKAASVWRSDSPPLWAFAKQVIESRLTVLRLQSRPQFQAVLAGVTVARTQHFALHCLALPLADTSSRGLFAVDGAWLGAMVPKRWARRAVTRNAIKRQVYALGQTFETSLGCSAHVVRLRSGFDRQQFASATSLALKTALKSELVQLFGKTGASCSSAV